MKPRTDFNLLSAIVIALFLVCVTASAGGIADTRPDAEQALLKRIYQMRMAYDQERAQKENEARANVRLVTQNPSRGADSPTVTSMRKQTTAQLVRYEQQFRCLDVDVDSNGGNTVVICGDNSGDITGSNVSAERDIVTIPGARP